jgi:hypothetical protein
MDDVRRSEMTWRTLLFTSATAIALVGCASKPTVTQREFDGGLEQTTQTASYEITIWTGPEVTMMMEFPIMAMMDQGNPVNHHLEVHIVDKGTGEEVLEVTPTVEILGVGTGVSRGLPNVKACLESNHRATAPHFGDNLFLTEGAYKVTVEVEGEIAEFEITF